MIEGGLHFERGLEPILEAFTTLPSAVRPVHFSKNETPDYPGSIVSDRSKLADFAAKNGSGFFLLGSTVTYSIRAAVGQPVVCDCFMNVVKDDVRKFMEHMAAAQPAFGFACIPEERAHRNGFALKMGEQTIEGWIGRDIGQYLPGLYWMTLVSESLARRHHLGLERVAGAALDHQVIRESGHLFQFFERPEDWARYADRLDALCREFDGVFSKGDAISQLAGAKNLIDVSSLVARWR